MMDDRLLAAERALSFGMLDEAERLLRQAVADDPSSSIAVLGLARVALDRGDNAGALAFAQQALELEPANDAAQRLVTRLEEIRHHRDVRPPRP